MNILPEKFDVEKISQRMSPITHNNAQRVEM
jgi:hypothetical protein